MRHSVDPRQGRLFDPFEGMIPPLGRDRIHNGWQGIFRTALLELMPARQLGKHFSATIGRPTKELYSVAGLLFLQEFQNWTAAETVEAYLFRTDIQFALNLEPGCDEMCERTYERYRALFVEDEGAGQVMQGVTDRLIELLEVDIRKQRLDSTHVFSNMASFGRTRLMAVTIKRFLTQVKRHCLADFEALPIELRQRYAPSQAQLLSKESKDADGRAKSRQQVAEDLRDLINRFADHSGLRDRPRRELEVGLLPAAQAQVLAVGYGFQSRLRQRLWLAPGEDGQDLFPVDPARLRRVARGLGMEEAQLVERFTDVRAQIRAIYVRHLGARQS